MTIEAGSQPDDGAESSATLTDSSTSGGFDAAGPVPSRVDAGGGYLARARAESGVNWLVVAGVIALLAVPGARAYRAARR